MGKYIKKYSLRDKETLLILSKCGKASQEQLTSNVNNLKEKRLYNLCREGILEKEYISTSKYEKDIVCYKLTNLGKDLAKEKFQIDNFYKSNGNSHDLILAQKYLSLTETERATWKTETELQADFRHKLDVLRGHDEMEKYEDLLNRYESREISICDATYVSDSGEIVVYEAVTSSYGKQELQAKIEFCKAMDLPTPTFERLH